MYIYKSKKVNLPDKCQIKKLIGGTKNGFIYFVNGHCSTNCEGEIRNVYNNRLPNVFCVLWFLILKLFSNFYCCKIYFKGLFLGKKVELYTIF